MHGDSMGGRREKTTNETTLWDVEDGQLICMPLISILARASGYIFLSTRRSSAQGKEGVHVPSACSTQSRVALCAQACIQAMLFRAHIQALQPRSNPYGNTSPHAHRH